MIEQNFGPLAVIFLLLFVVCYGVVQWKVLMKPPKIPDKEIKLLVDWDKYDVLKDAWLG
jgi:hypothetical protein